MARRKGFEPPFFRIGICCVIQLRHRRMYEMPNNRKALAETSAFTGAGSGGRTRTVSLPPDFESGTSANSNTPAIKK